jgi:hypothetical protein
VSELGRQPIEDVIDEALQRLLDGESAEAILARYPEYADELGSLLFAAGTLKQLPQPQLPQASLAAMVARAQAQAASDRKTAPIIVPPVGLDRGATADQIERVTTPQKVAGKVSPPNRKASWAERIGAWMRPPGLLSRAPAALALALILLLGVYAASRLVDQPQPPVLTVPTVSSQFTLDGTIEQMASDSWLVGGSRIYLDAKTVISGTPSVGAQAHIEGEIGTGDRRLAQSIAITRAAGTATVAVSIVATAKVDTGPTVPPLTVTVTITPGIVATGTVEAIAIVPPGGTLVPDPSGTPLHAAPGTTTPGSLPRPPAPVAPTATQTPPSSPPTATTQPSSTSVPQIPATSTAEPAPTDTRIPEPGPSSTATEIGSPTAIPSHTPEPEPTGEPTGEPTEEPSDTPGPHPSATSRPTESPEPEDSPTPLPTSPEPSRTPTTAPTATGVMPTATPVVPTTTQTVAPPASPTRTEVPQETETAQPTGTGEPDATNTAQPSETSQPTLTSEPTGTVQPTRTDQPVGTYTAEPTGEPGGTQTPNPTHSAGR